MKYLVFSDPNQLRAKIGAEFERKLIGTRWQGIGAYEDKDAEILLGNLPPDLRKEITEDQYLGIKKKQPITYRLLTPIQQRADRDPNAVYVEAAEAAPSKTAEELISVGTAIVDDPLEE